MAAHSSSAALEQLIEAVNHTLRTPLGVALGVLRDADAGYELEKADFRDAVQALERIEHILRSLRAEAGFDTAQDLGTAGLHTCLCRALKEANLLVDSENPSSLSASADELPHYDCSVLIRGLSLVFRALGFCGLSSVTVSHLGDVGSEEKAGGGYLVNGSFERIPAPPPESLSTELLLALGLLLIKGEKVSLTIEEQNGSFRGIVRSDIGHNRS